MIAHYRLRRATHLGLGGWAPLANLLLAPVLLWCRWLGGRHEFPATAEIGRGLFIAHPCRAIVVHGLAVIGRDCYLTGGNVIGVRRDIERGELVLGDHVMLGIDARVIGPLKVGDDVRIGAGAVVVRDVPAGTTMVGVPATPVHAPGGAPSDHLVNAAASA